MSARLQLLQPTNPTSNNQDCSPHAIHQQLSCHSRRSSTHNQNTQLLSSGNQGWSQRTKKQRPSNNNRRSSAGSQNANRSVLSHELLASIEVERQSQQSKLGQSWAQPIGLCPPSSTAHHTSGGAEAINVPAAVKEQDDLDTENLVEAAVSINDAPSDFFVPFVLQPFLLESPTSLILNRKERRRARDRVRSKVQDEEIIYEEKLDAQQEAQMRMASPTGTSLDKFGKTKSVISFDRNSQLAIVHDQSEQSEEVSLVQEHDETKDQRLLPCPLDQNQEGVHEQGHDQKLAQSRNIVINNSAKRQSQTQITSKDAVRGRDMIPPRPKSKRTDSQGPPQVLKASPSQSRGRVMSEDRPSHQRQQSATLSTFQSQMMESTPGLTAKLVATDGPNIKITSNCTSESSISAQTKSVAQQIEQAEACELRVSQGNSAYDIDQVQVPLVQDQTQKQLEQSLVHEPQPEVQTEVKPDVQQTETTPLSQGIKDQLPPKPLTLNRARPPQNLVTNAPKTLNFADNLTRLMLSKRSKQKHQKNALKARKQSIIVSQVLKDENLLQRMQRESDTLSGFKNQINSAQSQSQPNAHHLSAAAHQERIKQLNHALMSDSASNLVPSQIDVRSIQYPSSSLELQHKSEQPMVPQGSLGLGVIRLSTQQDQQITLLAPGTDAQVAAAVHLTEVKQRPLLSSEPGGVSSICTTDQILFSSEKANEHPAVVTKAPPGQKKKLHIKHLRRKATNQGRSQSSKRNSASQVEKKSLQNSKLSQSVRVIERAGSREETGTSQGGLMGFGMNPNERKTAPLQIIDELSQQINHVSSKQKEPSLRESKSRSGTRRQRRTQQQLSLVVKKAKSLRSKKSVIATSSAVSIGMQNERPQIQIIDDHSSQGLNAWASNNNLERTPSIEISIEDHPLQQIYPHSTAKQLEVNRQITFSEEALYRMFKAEEEQQSQRTLTRTQQVAQFSPDSRLPHHQISSNTAPKMLPPTQKKVSLIGQNGALPQSKQSTALSRLLNDPLKMTVSSSTQSLLAANAPQQVKAGGPHRKTHALLPQSKGHQCSKQKQPTQGVGGAHFCGTTNVSKTTSSDPATISSGGAPGGALSSAQQLLLPASPHHNPASLKLNPASPPKRKQPIYKMRILRTSSHTIHEMDKARKGKAQMMLMTSPSPKQHKQLATVAVTQHLNGNSISGKKAWLAQSQGGLKSQITVSSLASSNKKLPPQLALRPPPNPLLHKAPPVGKIKSQGGETLLGSNTTTVQNFYRQLSDRSHQPVSKRGKLLELTSGPSPDSGLILPKERLQGNLAFTLTKLADKQDGAGNERHTQSAYTRVEPDVTGEAPIGEPKVWSPPAHHLRDRKKSFQVRQIHHLQRKTQQAKKAVALQRLTASHGQLSFGAAAATIGAGENPEDQLSQGRSGARQYRLQQTLATAAKLPLAQARSIAEVALVKNQQNQVASALSASQTTHVLNPQASSILLQTRPSQFLAHAAASSSIGLSPAQGNTTNTSSASNLHLLLSLKQANPYKSVHEKRILEEQFNIKTDHQAGSQQPVFRLASTQSQAAALPTSNGALNTNAQQILTAASMSQQQQRLAKKVRLGQKQRPQSSVGGRRNNPNGAGRSGNLGSLTSPSAAVLFQNKGNGALLSSTQTNAGLRKLILQQSASGDTKHTF